MFYIYKLIEVKYVVCICRWEWRHGRLVTQVVTLHCVCVLL